MRHSTIGFLVVLMFSVGCGVSDSTSTGHRDSSSFPDPARQLHRFLAALGVSGDNTTLVETDRPQEFVGLMDAATTATLSEPTDQTLLAEQIAGITGGEAPQILRLDNLNPQTDSIALTTPRHSVVTLEKRPATSASVRVVIDNYGHLSEAGTTQLDIFYAEDKRGSRFILMRSKEGVLEGVQLDAAGRKRWLTTANTLVADANADLYVLLPVADGPKSSSCGVQDHNIDATKNGSGGSGGEGLDNPTTMPALGWILHADIHALNLFSSREELVRQLLAALSMDKFMYERDVAVSIVPRVILISTYDVFPNVTDGVQLLNAFTTKWRTDPAFVSLTQSISEPINITQYITHRALNAYGGPIDGIASVGGICGNGAGGITGTYSIVKLYSNTTHWQTGLFRNTEIIGHEAGHNVGVGHCQHSSPTCRLMDDLGNTQDHFGQDTIPSVMSIVSGQAPSCFQQVPVVSGYAGAPMLMHFDRQVGVDPYLWHSHQDVTVVQDQWGSDSLRLNRRSFSSSSVQPHAMTSMFLLDTPSNVPPSPNSLPQIMVSAAGEHSNIAYNKLKIFGVKSRQHLFDIGLIDLPILPTGFGFYQLSPDPGTFPNAGEPLQIVFESDHPPMTSGSKFIDLQAIAIFQRNSEIRRFWSSGVDTGIGSAVAGDTDVNGDGFDDLIIGDPIKNTHGEVLVKSGYNGNTLLQIASPVQATGGRPSARFGHAVAPVGDFNHDGYEDFAVGAPGADTFFVYSGANGALLYQVSGPLGSDYGHAVVQMDRLDFVVGAPLATDTNQSTTGMAEIVRLNPAGPHIIRRVFGDNADDRFGWSVAAKQRRFQKTMAIVGACPSAGNSTLNGYAKIPYYEFGDPVVTKPGSTPAYGCAVSMGWGHNNYGGNEIAVADSDAGVIDIFRAYHPNFPLNRSLTVLPSSQHMSIAFVGDADGDRHGDLLVGQPNVREAVLFCKNDITACAVYNNDFRSNSHISRFGYAVAAGGDINGDGLDDVIVGGASQIGGAHNWRGEVAALTLADARRGMTPHAVSGTKMLDYRQERSRLYVTGFMLPNGFTRVSGTFGMSMQLAFLNGGTTILRRRDFNGEHDVGGFVSPTGTIPITVQPADGSFEIDLPITGEYPGLYLQAGGIDWNGNIRLTNAVEVRVQLP